MSQPDHDAIVNEIRSAQITASPELRERVRGLAAAAPPARRRGRGGSCPGAGGRSSSCRPRSRSRSPPRWRSASPTPGRRSTSRASGGTVEAQRQGAPRSLPFTGPAQDSTSEYGYAFQREGGREGRQHSRDAGPRAAVRDRADAEGEGPLECDQARAAADPRLPRLRAQRRLRLGERTRPGLHDAAGPGRERSGRDRQVLGARRDHRPARLDQGRPADARQALPADAGDPRLDREDPGEAGEPDADRGAAGGPRERAGRAAQAARRPPEAAGGAPAADELTRPSSSRCAPPTRPSSCRTSRTGSSGRSTARARSSSTRSRSSSTS